MRPGTFPAIRFAGAGRDLFLLGYDGDDVMQVSFPEDVTERLTAKASEMNLPPEEVVKFIVETILGPSTLDIDQEIAQDQDLGAALERARADVRAGRVFNHAEVVEWHRRHPE
jgi:hypothetical protein